MLIYLFSECHGRYLIAVIATGPINSKCKRARLTNDTSDEDTATAVQMDINKQKLKSLSGRMMVIEQEGG